MKKIMLVAAVATFALGLGSCKKDYTCTCTATGLNIGGAQAIGKMKKADAETTCSTRQASLRAGGFSDANCSI